MKQRKWILKKQDEKAVAALAKQMNIPVLAARLFVARGQDTMEKVNKFQCKKIDDLYDPFLMKDMQKAVDTINESVAAGEKIMIYGDYDVDGVTSTAILYRYLKSRGAAVDYYIPDRAEEGYGVNLLALDEIAGRGAKLLITVDSGITAQEEIAHAASLGVKTIVTDHHECKQQLPECCAVVNPKRPDCGYPFKELAGVGVALKLICALEGRENLQNVIDEYCELAAFGTIADVMPLVGENRIIVSLGLNHMAKTRNVGLAALISRAGLGGKKITAGTIGYTLAPRINAAGRIGCASSSVELFLTEDPKKAAEIASQLCEVNRVRQEEENVILKQALEMIEQDEDFGKKKIIILSHDGWHHGVIGIVASRLSDKFYLPSVLISFDGDDVGKGSGRSIKNFNLYEAIESVSSHVTKFGGHALAAGLSIERGKLADFERDLYEYASTHITDKQLCPETEIDCELRGGDVNLKTVEEISCLEPYGMGNPAPVFLLRDATVIDTTPLGADKHTKMTLQKDGEQIVTVCFGKPHSTFEFHPGDMVDIICNLDVNNFRGEQSVQVSVKDIRLSEEYARLNEKTEQAFFDYLETGSIPSEAAELLVPSRDEFITVYNFITVSAPIDSAPFALYSKSGAASGGKFNLGKFLTCLKVFSDEQMIELELTKQRVWLRLIKNCGKKNLDNSPTLAGLKKIRAGNKA